MPLIPNLSLYLIQKFDRLALWGNLTILELHFAETQVNGYTKNPKWAYKKSMNHRKKSIRKIHHTQEFDTLKSKNSESFYITQSYTNANGKSTSKTIRKLGTLAELSVQLHTDRDGAVVFSVIGILYLTHRGKGKLAASLIPQVRDTNSEVSEK